MSGMPYPFAGVSEGDRALLAQMTREQLIIAAARVTLHQKRLQHDILDIGSEDDLRGRVNFLARSESAFDQSRAASPHLAGQLAQIGAWVQSASDRGDARAIQSLRLLARDPAMQGFEPRHLAPAAEPSPRMNNAIEGVGVAGIAPVTKGLHEQYYRDGSSASSGGSQYRASGQRIETAMEDTATVSSMLDLATRQGWSSIRTYGSAAFRQSVWLEGMARGINVQGYTPTAQELDQGTKRAAAAGTLSKIDDPAVKAFLNARTSDERTAAATTYPQLKSAFSLQASAAKFAEEVLAASARPAFMERFRQNLAADLAKGVELPAVQIREQQQRRTRDQASGR